MCAANAATPQAILEIDGVRPEVSLPSLPYRALKTLMFLAAR